MPGSVLLGTGKPVPRGRPLELGVPGALKDQLEIWSLERWYGALVRPGPEGG